MGRVILINAPVDGEFKAFVATVAQVGKKKKKNQIV